MKFTSRVIIGSVIFLVAIIVGLVIVMYFHLPWLWPAEKWADFWVAVFSGVIITATIGALVTFLVERILRDIEEQNTERQFQIECEREWREFQQRLSYVVQEDIIYFSDLDYPIGVIPHYAISLAKLLETAPLLRWQQGLKSFSILLFNLNNFVETFLDLKSEAYNLSKSIKKKINQYNRKQAADDKEYDSSVDEDAQFMFCLALILEDNIVNKMFASDRAGKQVGSPGYEVVEAGYKSMREQELNRVGADILWNLHIPETVLPDWLKLYDFVKGKMIDIEIDGYIFSRERLSDLMKEIRGEVFKNTQDIHKNEARIEIYGFIGEWKKKKILEPIDQMALFVYKSYMVEWREELGKEKSKAAKKLVKNLDELIRQAELVEKIK